MTTSVATETQRFRRHKGIVGVIERTLLVLIVIVGIMGIIDVFLFFGVGVWQQQYLATLLGLVLATIPLIVPARKSDSQMRPPWYDVLLSIAGLFVGLYLAAFYPKLQITIAYITSLRVILSVLMIALVLESCRRLFGWPLVVITILFLLYSHFGYLVPGALNIKGLPWKRIVTHLFIDPESLLGIPLRIIGTIVLAFILFGRVLFNTGGGSFISDAALSLVGKFRGGPAKVAVFASAGFGSLSGSVVGNVVTTGIVTIPLIKKAGYKSSFAGAVEAAASTGGAIMPPVMGAAAFLMASILGLPYAQVVLAALIPAILYFVGLFVQVDLEAAKRGIKGFKSQDLPSFGRVIKGGWIFLIPVVVIVYTLFVLFLDPDMSALYAVLSTLVVVMFKRASRLNIRKLVAILEATGEALLDILTIGAAAGVIVGSIFLTGLGSSFSQWLLQLGGGSLFFLLLVTAMAAIVLGMGMAVAAVYIVVVVLIAPALTQAGMFPIVAHLFVLYYAVLSFLTPPVCIAVYAAASIAHSGPMRTGLQAVRLAIAAYLVPFAFAFNPALICRGTLLDILVSFGLATLGLIALAAGFAGYIFRDINWPKRILSLSAGVCLMAPWWICRGAGISVVIALGVWELLATKRQQA